MIQQAEWIAGVTLTEAERKRLALAMTQQLRSFEQLRKVSVPNYISPALVFQPIGAHQGQRELSSISLMMPSSVNKPATDEELAFSSVITLSHLIRTRKISSKELTQFYLKRLRQYDPALLCVVSYTDDLALKQAEQADNEIAHGNYRGPLHGIPWGAKDLISYPGYKTTWGAGPFKEQTLNTKATVAGKLEEETEAGEREYRQRNVAVAERDRHIRGRLELQRPNEQTDADQGEQRTKCAGKESRAGRARGAGGHLERPPENCAGEQQQQGAGHHLAAVHRDGETVRRAHWWAPTLAAEAAALPPGGER